MKPTLAEDTTRQHPGFVLAWAAVIAVAVVACYADSLNAPFVFDDLNTIVGNRSIQNGWGVWEAIFGQTPTTVSSRPVAAFTFALNHRFGGLDPRGYHAVNILIHLLAALTLLGLVRRTLLLPSVGWSARQALWAAGAAALVWAVHPLNTACVTYTAQRVESLVSLFYLLTLYCFVRGCTGCAAWHVAAVLSCLLGMGTKEIMISTPLAVLAYDRVFVATSWRQVMARRTVHAPIAATSIALIAILLNGKNRFDSAGFHFENLTWWDYLRMQPGALMTYFKLSFWPNPLVFDYGAALEGVSVPDHWSQYVPQGLSILALVGVTGWLLWRRPVWGWPGLVFFMVLAPTSSFLPIVTEVIAEHRFYLPLAILAATLAVAVVAVVSRRPGIVCVVAAGALLVVTVSLGYATDKRNDDYRTAMRLWQDTVDKRPANERARVNLSFELIRERRYAEVISALRPVVERKPAWPDPRYGLAMALLNNGQVTEAIEQFDILLDMNPHYVAALNGKAMALARTGQLADAERLFAAAVEKDPHHLSSLSGLGRARMNLGDTRGAVDPLRRAVELNPDHLDALKSLAWIMATSSDPLLRDGPRALALAEHALRLTQGDDPEALDALAAALAETGQFVPAQQIIEQAVIASRKRNNFLMAEILKHGEAYRQGKPWRE